MSALEQEIVDKYHQLDNEAKARVRAIIAQDDEYATKRANFDYEAWFRDVNAIRQKITEDNGGVFPKIDAVGMLREIRDGEDDE